MLRRTKRDGNGQKFCGLFKLDDSAVVVDRELQTTAAVASFRD